MALYDRVLQLLEETGLTPSELAKRAGVSRSQVHVFLGRGKKAPEKASLTLDTAIKIADATGVDWTWFSRGLGSPKNDALAAPVCIAREQAIALLTNKPDLVDPAVLSALALEPVPPGDPGPRYWLDRAAQLQRDLAHAMDAFSRPTPTPEPVPNPVKKSSPPPAKARKRASNG